jgi:hypothetical protein
VTHDRPALDSQNVSEMSPAHGRPGERPVEGGGARRRADTRRFTGCRGDPPRNAEDEAVQQVNDRSRSRSVRPSSSRCVEPGPRPHRRGERCVACGERTKEANASGRLEPRVRLRTDSDAMSWGVSFSAGDVSSGVPSSPPDFHTQSTPTENTAGAVETSTRMSQASRHTRPEGAVHTKARPNSTSMPPRRAQVKNRAKPAETCFDQYTRPAEMRPGASQRSAAFEHYGENPVMRT